jgi:hypothetical protein
MPIRTARHGSDASRAIGSGSRTCTPACAVFPTHYHTCLNDKESVRRWPRRRRCPPSSRSLSRRRSALRTGGERASSSPSFPRERAFFSYPSPTDAIWPGRRRALRRRRSAIARIGREGPGRHLGVDRSSELLPDRDAISIHRLIAGRGAGSSKPPGVATLGAPNGLSAGRGAGGIELAPSATRARRPRGGGHGGCRCGRAPSAEARPRGERWRHVGATERGAAPRLPPRRRRPRGAGPAVTTGEDATDRCCTRSSGSGAGRMPIGLAEGRRLGP